LRFFIGGIVGKPLAGEAHQILAAKNVGPDVLLGQLRPKSGIVEGLVGREVFAV
jgi:hypothetical protein